MSIWTYGVLDVYADEYATDREFSSFVDAVAWAQEHDRSCDQFAIAMWDDTREQLRLLRIS